MAQDGIMGFMGLSAFIQSRRVPFEPFYCTLLHLCAALAHPAGRGSLVPQTDWKEIIGRFLLVPCSRKRGSTFEIWLLRFFAFRFEPY
jgi:hypothetical protein